MRLYSFCNYYLSPLQQGLQTAHLVGELSLENHIDYENWARDHKTIIILNGGNSADLSALYGMMVAHIGDMCIASFHEDTASLNGALTCVGVIVPSFYCTLIDNYRLNGEFFLSPYDVSTLSERTKEMLVTIAGYSLAK